MGTNKLKYEYDEYGRLKREVYPNGRSIDFTYDSGFRLSTVKDPFGYLNQAIYDNDGRLSTLAHSSLGTATFTYNNTTDDRLTTLTLGNGARTGYLYDGYGRLDGFDIRNGSGARLVMHEWTYDSLGRKGDITVTSPLFSQNLIDITYDGASRLKRETFKVSGGATTWDMQYSYDQSGNRTALNDGTINKTMTYGAGNREATVSGGGTALSYDFKGNVTSRPPLGGSNAYNYKWNVYDQLIQTTRTGQTTVDYTYDALGRLLYRAKGSSEKTHYYWLGLNRIAEEERGSEAGASLEIRRPDDEIEATPASNGWDIYNASGSPSMAYATDSTRGKVLRLQSSSTFGGMFVIGDHGTLNMNTTADGAKWDDSSRKHLGMWIKNASGLGDKRLQIVVLCQLNDGGQYQLSFVTGAGTDNWSGSCLTDYIGTSYNNNQWAYLEFDLAERVSTLTGMELSLSKVHGVLIRCADLYVDDIILSGGSMKKSYAVSANPSIGSHLGQQANALGTKTYFHQDDGETVLATTGSDGNLSGCWTPDFYGQYRFVYSGPTRPDVSLTSKVADPDSGLYYFGYRWYDSERGRWMSVEPSGLGLNFYAYARNNAVNFYDDNGLFPHRRPTQSTGSKTRTRQYHNTRHTSKLRGTNTLPYNVNKYGNPKPKKIRGPKGGGAGTLCFLGGIAIELVELNAYANDLREEANELWNDVAEMDWEDCNDKCMDEAESYHDYPVYDGVEVKPPPPSVVYLECMKQCGQASGTF